MDIVFFVGGTPGVLGGIMEERIAQASDRNLRGVTSPTGKRARYMRSFARTTSLSSRLA